MDAEIIPAGKYELIKPESHEGRFLYHVVGVLIEESHDHLAEAQIAFAWKFGTKPDADGRLCLGKARKVRELDVKLHGYDFVIELNHEAWRAADFDDAQKAALVDHELCHCAVARDSQGEPKKQPNGRLQWRIRKHDIEEFNDVVERHGTWKAELELFAREALEKKSPELHGKLRRPE